MHGGASTGPKTADGIARIRRARLKNGRYLADLIMLRRAMAEQARFTHELIRQVRS